MSTLSAELIASKAKPLPKGWQSIEQICKEEGLSLNHTRLVVRTAVKAGILETQKWPLMMCNGVPRSVPIYRRVKQ
jgi:hypothetical protein